MKMKGKKKVGQVHLHFYTDKNGLWEIRVAVGKNDLPDPKIDLRSYIKMGLLAAQINAYAAEQIKALDLLLITKEE